MVGTRAEIWVGNQKTERVHDHPTDNAALQFELLFDNPFVHSSMLISKSAFDAVGGYTTDPTRQPPEDYELWSRIARRYNVANLPERLTIYREVRNSMSREPQTAFRERIGLISAENLAAATGGAAPWRHHWDIAALLHHLPEKLSAKPDLEAMCKIIQRAGKRIHARCPGSDVPMRVTSRINRLRHHYMEYKLLSNSILLRRLVGVVRRSRRLREIKRRLIG